MPPMVRLSGLDQSTADSQSKLSERFKEWHSSEVRLSLKVIRARFYCHGYHCDGKGEPRPLSNAATALWQVASYRGGAQFTGTVVLCWEASPGHETTAFG